MNNRLTDREREHLGRVKELPCSVCDMEGPSEAHHAQQGQQYTAIALCPPCHRGPIGWHGTKALWRIRKLDELGALNITLDRLMRELA
mgnify:CR=1 FL=1